VSSLNGRALLGRVEGSNGGVVETGFSASRKVGGQRSGVQGSVSG